MAILEVLQYPHQILRCPCAPIQSSGLETQELRKLIGDMIDTMYFHHGCVGLAAPQVGQSLQVFVMDSCAKTDRSKLRVIINPRLNELSRWKYSKEGCLSLPDYFGTVKRARKISASWQNQFQEELILDLTDYEAVIFQHEFDHLQGVMFIDRLRDIGSGLRNFGSKNY